MAPLVPASNNDPADLDFPNPEDESSPSARDYLRFVLGSARRRPFAFAAVLISCVAVLVVYYASTTPQYRAETRILAQRQQSLPSIIRSNASEDQPTRAAGEIILRRESILSLIKVAGLVESPPKGDAVDQLRSAATRLQDAGDATNDREADLVAILKRKLKVSVGEVTIAIELDWPDRRQAYLIVEGALQDFLEARHVQDVTALDEAISIRQGRVATAREELNRAIEEARRAYPESGRAARPPLPTATGASQPRPSGSGEELARVRSLLEAKERAIADVEGFRRRRLTELQAQYDARRAVYAEAHPEMLGLRQDIASLSLESPQIATLRQEESQLRQEEGRLRAEYQASYPRERASASAAPGSLSSGQRTPLDGPSGLVEQSEPVREARARYQQVLDSVQNAQAALDTARAAFKHRYQVTWPTQVSERPVSPNPVKVFGIGGLASLLLALFVAAALDWRSGQLHERWQIERGLRLPILSELGGP